MKAIIKILFNKLREKFCNHFFVKSDIPYVSEKGEEYIIYQCEKCDYIHIPKVKLKKL
tara:strand:+ start:1446 stop:1619 length:174 start_codon:yes stop_codon:yes gene_type:complete